MLMTAAAIVGIIGYSRPGVIMAGMAGSACRLVQLGYSSCMAGRTEMAESISVRYRNTGNSIHGRLDIQIIFSSMRIMTIIAGLAGLLMYHARKQRFYILNALAIAERRSGR